MSERVRLFDGIENFRDYGGYPVAGGGRLRDRWLYRSADYSKATAGDLATLSGLGIASVIDLRGPTERAEHPSPSLGRVPPRFVLTDVETGGVPPHLEPAVKGIKDAESAATALAAVYADIPCRPVIISTLRGYFAALADEDGPSLIHCAAGKDRTGVAVAILHAALGVHRDDIVADYLLTNTAGRFETRMARSIDTFREKFGPQFNDDAARALVTVTPRYINSTFTALDEKYGGLDGYLGTQLGVDAATRERLRLRLIV